MSKTVGLFSTIDAINVYTNIGSISIFYNISDMSFTDLQFSIVNMSC